MSSEVIRVAKDFIELFERLNIPYVVIGGFAVRVYALPRPTFDVDFTALISDEQLSDVLFEADRLGYAYPDSVTTGWRDRVRGMPVLKFHYFVGGKTIDADVFLAESSFQHSLIDRRQLRETDGFQGWFATPEDVILLKLMASRRKDLVDIGDILLVSGDLDVDYMRNWAGELGVAQPLEDAFEESSR